MTLKPIRWNPSLDWSCIHLVYRVLLLTYRIDFDLSSFSFYIKLRSQIFGFLPSRRILTLVYRIFYSGCLYKFTWSISRRKKFYSARLAQHTYIQENMKGNFLWGFNLGHNRSCSRNFGNVIFCLKKVYSTFLIGTYDIVYIHQPMAGSILRVYPWIFANHDKFVQGKGKSCNVMILPLCNGSWFILMRNTRQLGDDSFFKIDILFDVINFDIEDPKVVKKNLLLPLSFPLCKQ